MTAELNFTPLEFRRALGAFMTGVTVVTTMTSENEPRGFTASSFTSVSLSPPLILVCIDKNAASYTTFAASTRFTVNILAEYQAEISTRFASKSADKFAGIEWCTRSGSGPIIIGSAAWIDCNVHQKVDAGDHVILIGRVLQFESTPIAALGYWRGTYFAPAYGDASKGNRVGAILEKDGAVVLLDRGEAGYDLPTAKKLFPVNDPNSLHGILRQFGVVANLEFLFAVFEDARHKEGPISVFYRGTMESGPVDGTAIRMILFDEVFRLKFVNYAVESMIHRFVKERKMSAFGVYMGDSEKGTVSRLSKADIS